MAKPPRRVLWDACCWIAHIKQEMCAEDRARLCSVVLGHARAKEMELVTSTLALVEVRKAGVHPDADTDDKIRRFFDQDYILLVPVDIRIGRKARELGLKHGLDNEDAVYLATACVLDIDVLHSFDRDLLSLNGKVFTDQGDAIRICWPEPSALRPAPLFDDPGDMPDFGAFA